VFFKESQAYAIRVRVDQHMARPKEKARLKPRRKGKIETMT
jgi:hypothetical protein